MAPDSDEVVLKINGKHLLGIFLIFLISLFVVASYVNALTSFQPSFVSQYAPPRRPPPLFIPPFANAGLDQDVIIYEVVLFDGSGSIDADGEIVSYSWDFGDGTNASGIVVTHKYASEEIFTATITVSDNVGQTDTDTSVITVSMPTFDEISRLPVEDSASILELLPPEDSMEILMNLNSSFAADIFEELNVSVALNVVDAAILANYTTDMSGILLGVESEYAAEVIIGLDTELGVELIESMMEINVTGCAYVVESAVFIDLNSSVKLFEEILMNLNSSFAADIFEELNVSVALDVADAAILANHTTDMSGILLGVESEYAAEVIIGLDTELGVELIESMMEINATGCAYVVESAVFIDLNSSATIIEGLDDEILAELLLEIAGLPSTPGTVATIFEYLSIEKVHAVSKEWISLGELQMLDEVFVLLEQETLNGIFDLLSMTERVAIYPYLSTTTLSLIRRELLPIPEIGLTPITVSRLDSTGYNVSVAVHNRGNVETDNIFGEFWVEGNLVSTFEIPDLSTDSSTEVSFMWKPPSKGVYTLEVFLDPENIIEEIDETNNEILTSYGVELPELQVAFETVPTEFVKGKSYVLEIAVSNTGEEEAVDFDLVLEASGIIVEQGTVRWTSFTIGSSQVDSLPVGTSRVFDFSWEPEVEGAYTFLAMVDTQEQVLEGNRANNDISLQIEVETRPPVWPYMLISMVIVVTVVGVIALTRPQTFDFLRQLKSQEA